MHATHISLFTRNSLIQNGDFPNFELNFHLFEEERKKSTLVLSIFRNWTLWTRVISVISTSSNSVGARPPEPGIESGRLLEVPLSVRGVVL